MAKSDYLASNFVSELISASLSKRTTFDIVRQYLKFSYLQIESEKKLWQWVVKTYDLKGRIPTIGQIQQQFQDDDSVLEKLEEIREADVDENNHDDILASFEKFIKRMKFLEANDRITELYNQGNKEQSWDMFVKYAEEFSKFSIQDAKFERVFSDFAERQARRKSEDWNFRFKIPTGIDELDFRLGGTNGGPETGECVLWLGDSGAGKSQVLVSVGISAARQGFRVAHFQLEGTREQCLNRYDAA